MRYPQMKNVRQFASRFKIQLECLTSERRARVRQECHEPRTLDRLAQHPLFAGRGLQALAAQHLAVRAHQFAEGFNVLPIDDDFAAGVGVCDTGLLLITKARKLAHKSFSVMDLRPNRLGYAASTIRRRGLQVEIIGTPHPQSHAAKNTNFQAKQPDFRRAVVLN